MDKKQKRTLVLASIIGTLLDSYEEDEKTRLHKEIHAGIGKGIRKKGKTFGVENVIKITHEDGKKIWDKTVDHFKESGVSIEASSCIVAIWISDEKAIAKQFSLSSGKLEKWAKPCRTNDRIALEKAGNEVARFVFDEASRFYGIKIEEKMSVLERIAQSRKVA